MEDWYTPFTEVPVVFQFTIFGCSNMEKENIWFNRLHRQTHSNTYNRISMTDCLLIYGKPWSSLMSSNLCRRIRVLCISQCVCICLSNQGVKYDFFFLPAPSEYSIWVWCYMWFYHYDNKRIKSLYQEVSSVQNVLCQQMTKLFFICTFISS